LALHMVSSGAFWGRDRVITIFSAGKKKRGGPREGISGGSTKGRK